MHPILLKLGSVTFHSYGLLIAMGFLAGLFLFRAEARRMGEDPDQVTDLCFYLLVAALVGARLLYVLTTPRYFFENPGAILKIWNGGLVFYGGFLAALAAALVYFRRQRLNAWRWADMGTPALAIGQCCGRLGCFLAGCCYGRACDLPWAVTFNDRDSLAPIGQRLHPTQLYEAAVMFALFVLLWTLRGKKRYDGQLFWSYVLLYGLARSVIEGFRGDFRGGLAGEWLSPSQIIGFAMAALAVAMLLALGRVRKAAP